MVEPKLSLADVHPSLVPLQCEKYILKCYIRWRIYEQKWESERWRNIMGLFTWAQSTSLAHSLRSRLATLFFFWSKFWCVHIYQDENFSMWTLQPGWPGWNFFDKIAWLLQHSSQNGVILALYVFPLKKYVNMLCK